MPKVGGRRKKTRTHKQIKEDDDTTLGQMPKSFIIKRGKVPQIIKEVQNDYREIMYPFTAINLKESDQNRIKDFLAYSGLYAMTHMVIFTATQQHNYVKFVKNPEGPTLTFQIVSFCTRKDVINHQSNAKSVSRSFIPPVLIMNGFNKEVSSRVKNPPSKEQYTIVSQMIQSMFPPINVKQLQINTVKRCILFSYDEEKDIINIRHYHIDLVPTSQNQNFKKIIKAQNPLNLKKYNTFSDYMKQQSGYGSQSEAEDLGDSKVDWDSKSASSKTNTFKKQLSIKLSEIGPRMQIRLHKIQEGFLKGNTFYNRVVIKTGEQISANFLKIKEKQKEKQRRKAELQQKLQQKEEERLRKQQSHNDQQNQKEQTEQGAFGVEDGEEEEKDQEIDEENDSDDDVIEKLQRKLDQYEDEGNQNNNKSKQNAAASSKKLASKQAFVNQEPEEDEGDDNEDDEIDEEEQDFELDDDVEISDLDDDEFEDVDEEAEDEDE